MQITDVFVTFEGRGGNYASCRAQEDATCRVEFSIAKTGNRNDAGDDEYAINQINLRLVAPDDDSDSEPDHYESFCNSL